VNCFDFINNKAYVSLCKVKLDLLNPGFVLFLDDLGLIQRKALLLSVERDVLEFEFFCKEFRTVVASLWGLKSSDNKWNSYWIKSLPLVLGKLSGVGKTFDWCSFWKCLLLRDIFSKFSVEAVKYDKLPDRISVASLYLDNVEYSLRDRSSSSRYSALGRDNPHLIRPDGGFSEFKLHDFQGFNQWTLKRIYAFIERRINLK
jgi:hypothetical protein